MKHEVALPADVERHLSERAIRTGQDVVHLIRIAVAQFIDAEIRPASIADWSEESQARRCELIDKEIAGTATVIERQELRELDRLANEYFDTVAPPPLEGARRLHQQLTQYRDSRD